MSGIHLLCARSKSRKGQIDVRLQGDNHNMELVEERDPVSGMKVDPSKAAASVEHHLPFLQSELRRKVPRRTGEIRAAWGIHLPHASRD